MSGYRIFISPAADRVFKKLPRRMREEIEDGFLVLSRSPSLGERLSGPLDFLYSYHFTVFGKYFRAAYTIDAIKKKIIIHYIGPRGEFYKRLRRLFEK